MKVLKEGSVGQRKLKSNTPYYFRSGFEIFDGDSLSIDTSMMCVSGLYDEMVTYGRKGTPHISISAIVGENGSGKSTLIEFMLRLLNNFAANTLGDTIIFPGTERLHHINNVYGEIYFVLDSVPYKLQMLNRRVRLSSYRLISSEGMKFEYRRVDVFAPSKRMPIFQPNNASHISLIQKIYHHFFYTMVCNYSIYAYNTHDYSDEINSEDEECKKRNIIKINNDKFGNINFDMRVCLRGIFHKNDGYQTPIVLFPYRSEGCIDINREKKLAEERLQTLILSENFSQINEHLEVVGYEIDFIVNSDFYFFKVREIMGVPQFEITHYCILREKIIGYWGRILGYDLLHNVKGYRHHERAIEYLVYKTIKTASKYITYKKFFDRFLKQFLSYRSDNTKVNERRYTEFSRDLITQLVKDRSHITRKIRLTLAYLQFGLYDSSRIAIKELALKLSYKLSSFKWKNDNNPFRRNLFNNINDLLPPPFLRVSLILKDIL